MNHAALFDRILAQVDGAAYLAYADVVDPDQAPAMREIESALGNPGCDADTVVALATALHAEGRIDKVYLLSALHVIAASPKTKNYDEAARLAAAQEQAALELGGPRLQANLASVERHRGVLAFVQERYEIALDYFSRAFERQHTAGNLANVLATLLRIGDITEARELHAQVCQNLHPDLVTALTEMVDADPDLASLRTESTP
jgi:tetratricopeptide (TPR) repeat protein